MISLRVSSSLEKEPQVYQFDSNITGDQLIKKYSQLSGISDPDNYCGRYLSIFGEENCIDLVLPIIMQGIIDGTIVYIVPRSNTNPLPKDNTLVFSSPDFTSDQAVGQEPINNTSTENCKIDIFDSQSSLKNQQDFSIASDIEVENDKHASIKSIKLHVVEGFNPFNTTTIIAKESFGFHDIIDKSCAALDLPVTNDFVILLKKSDGSSKWFEKESFIEEHSIGLNTRVIIMPKTATFSIKSDYFETISCTIDVTTPVKDITDQIIKNQKVGNSMTYSLFRKVSDSWDPLDPELSIGKQLDSMAVLKLKRRFLVFSYEDISEIKNSLNAYADAKRELKNSNVILNRKDLVELFAYGLLIENSPENFIHSLPPKYMHDKNIKSDTEKFLDSLKEKPDKINSIRLFIKKCRLIPGFGSELFPVKRDDKYYKMMVTPIGIYFIEPENDNLQKFIPYNKLVDSTTNEDIFTLTYVKKAGELNSISYSSISSRKIANIIFEYRSIIRRIFANRSILRYEGKWNGPLNSDQIELDTFDLTSRDMNSDLSKFKPHKFTYDKYMTGSILVETAASYLGIDNNPNFRLLLENFGGSYRLIQPNHVLCFLPVSSGSKIYLIDTKMEILVKTVDGAQLKLRLDATKPISELFKAVFDSLNLNPILGYGFYSINDSNKYMDHRFTMPEITLEYSKILFKRKYFILSRVDMQTDDHAFLTFNECRTWLMENQINISTDTMIELAILNILSGLSSPSQLDGMKSFELSLLIPKWFKITPEIENKFMKSISTYKRVDRFGAMRAFIRILKEIPQFGSESFSFLTPQNNSPDAEGKIVFTPIYIFLIVKGKIHSRIIYKHLHKYRSRVDSTELEYIDLSDNKKKMNTFMIKANNASEISNTITDYLDIYTQLIHERHTNNSIKKKEIEQRLTGGFCDEEGVHGPQRNFNVTTELGRTSCLRTLWFDLAYKQEQIVDKIVRLSQTDGKLRPLKKDDDYTLLNMIGGFGGTFLKKGQVFETIDPVRGSMLICMKEVQPIEISDYNGKSVTKNIAIWKPVKDIIKEVYADFGIKLPAQYSLYYRKNNELIPLELARSLPEQTTDFSHLSIRRRFFNISYIDFTDDYINKTYEDCLINIKEGNFSCSEEEAMELAYYQIVVMKNGKVRDSDNGLLAQTLIPPYNTNINKNTVKEFKKINSKKLDVKHAQSEFIQLVKRNQTFALEIYPIILLINNEEISSEIVITPKGVAIKERQSSKSIIRNISTFVDYDHIIESKAIIGEFAIKYIDGALKVRYIHGNGESAIRIVNTIIEYQRILSLSVRNIPRGDGIPNTARTVHLSCPNIDKDYIVKGIVDIRNTGNICTRQAVEALKINKFQNYKSMLQYTPQDSAWVQPQDLIGKYLPYDGIQMNVFSCFYPIIIQAPGKPSQKIIVDISLKTKELIGYLATRLYINNPIGYGIFYKDESNALKPLLLEKSIPEQVDINSRFVFRRRFFISTEQDLCNPQTIRDIYKDIKDYVMSGAIQLAQSKMILLAVYSIYASCKNQEEVSKYPLNDMSLFVPFGIPIKEWYIKKINSLLTTNYLESWQAMKNYIDVSRTLPFFGCENFPALNLSIDTNKKKKPFEHCLISVGPRGVQILNPEGNDAFISTAYNAITSAECLEGQLAIQFINTHSKGVSFSFQTENPQYIASLINEWRDIILPSIKARSRLQNKINNISNLSNDTVLLWASKTMDNPEQTLVSVPLNSTLTETLNKIADAFVMESPEDRLIALSTPNGLKWFDVNSLKEMNPNKYDRVFFMPHIQEVFVVTSGLINRLPIDLRKTVKEICFTLGPLLGMDLSDGYTLYPMTGERNQPLDINLELTAQTKFIHELSVRRRFFTVNKDFFRTNKSVEIFFADCRGEFISGRLKVSEETMAELAISEIASQAASPMELSSRTRNVDLSQYLPPGQKITQRINDRFKVLTRSMDKFIGVYAMRRYISICCDKPGFGAEEHEVSVTDVLDCSKKAGRKMIIILSPWEISFKDQMKMKTETFFDYDHLITFSKDGDSLTLKFINHRNHFCQYNIISEELPAVESYIKEIMSRLMKMDCITTSEEMKYLLWKDQKISGKTGAFANMSDMEIFKIYDEPIPGPPLKNNGLRYCGNNMAITSAAVCFQVVKETMSKIYEKMKLENQNESQVKDGLELIEDTIKILNDRAQKLDKIAGSEVMREDALYQAQATMESIQDTIEIIHLLSKDGIDLKTLGEQLESTLQPLNEAILWITTHNIIPTRVNDVSEAITTIGEQISHKIPESSSDLELKLIASVTQHSVEIGQRIRKHYKALQYNTVKEATIKGVQEDLHELLYMLPDIQKSINIISKNGDDTYILMCYERMISDLEAAMTEEGPSEPLSTLPHIVRFHNAQFELGNLIGLVFSVGEHLSIQANPQLKEKIDIISSYIHASYFELQASRVCIHSNPYGKDEIQKCIDSLEKIEKYTGLYQELSVSLSSVIQVSEIGSAINKLLKAVKLALITLQETQPRSYWPPPRINTQLRPLEHVINDIIQTIDVVRQNAGELSESVNQKIKNEVDEFSLIETSLKILIQKTDETFYEIGEKCRNRIQKFPSKFMDVPAISRSDILKDLVRSSVRSIDSILRPIQPTIKTAREYISILRTAMSKVFEYYDSIFNSIKIKDQNDFYKMSSKWRKSLDDAFQVISSHEQSLFYTITVMKKDLQAVQKVESLLQGLKFYVRSFLTEDQKVKFGLLISNSAAAAHLFITCALNIRRGLYAGIDISCFQLIDFNEDSAYACQEFVNQLNIFKDSFDEISKSAQVRAKQHTSKIVDRINNSLSIHAKYIGDNISDRELLNEALAQFLSEADELQERVNLVSPVLNLNVLSQSCNNLIINAKSVVKILKRQSQTDGSSEQFSKIAWPVIKANLNEIHLMGSPEPEKDLQQMIAKFIADTEYMTINGLSAKRREVLCDRLYVLSSTILEQIIDCENLQQYTIKIYNIYKAAEPFVTCQKRSIMFTGSLNTLSSPIPILTVSNTMEMILNYLESGRLVIPSELLAGISENLQVILDNNKLVPEFAYYGAGVMMDHIQSIENHEIILAALPILLSADKQSTKIYYLEAFAIHAYIRACSLIDGIRRGAEIAGVSNKTCQETHIYLSWIDSVTKRIDANTLVASKNISAIAIVYSAMHELKSITSCALYFLNGEASILEEAYQEYTNWLYTADLALQNLFYEHMSQMALSFEYLQKQADVFQQAAIVLKNKRRTFSIDWIDIQKLSRIALNINQEDISNFEEGKYKCHAESAFEKIKFIRSILFSWLSPSQSLSKTSIRTEITSHSYDITKNYKRYNRTSLRFGLGRPMSNNSYMKYLVSNSQFEIDLLKNPIKNIEDIFMMTLQTEDERNMVSIEVYISEIIQAISKFVDISLDDDFLINIDGITDADCLNAARKTAEFLNKINNMIKEIPNNSSSKKDDEFVAKFDFHKHALMSASRRIWSRDPNSKAQPDSCSEETWKALRMANMAIQLSALRNEQIEWNQDLEQIMQNNNAVRDIISNYGELDLVDGITAIKQQLYLFYDQKKIEQLQKRYRLEELVLQQCIIARLLHMIAEGCCGGDIDTVDLVSIMKRRMRNEKVDLGKTENAINYALEMRSRAILMVWLQAIANFILMFNRSVINYAQLPAGHDTLSKDISGYELTHCQEAIAYELQAGSSPEMLQSLFEKISPSDCITQLRLISEMLRTLSKFKYCSCHTPEEVFMYICKEQLIQLGKNGFPPLDALVELNHISRATSCSEDLIRRSRLISKIMHQNVISDEDKAILAALMKFGRELDAEFHFPIDIGRLSQGCEDDHGKSVIIAANAFSDSCSTSMMISNLIQAKKQIEGKAGTKNTSNLDSNLINSLKVAMNIASAPGPSLDNIDDMDLGSLLSVIDTMINEMNGKEIQDAMRAQRQFTDYIDVLAINGVNGDDKVTQEFLEEPTNTAQLKVILRLRKLMKMRMCEIPELQKMPKPKSIDQAQIISSQEALKKQLLEFKSEELHKFGNMELIIQQQILEHLCQIVQLGDFDGNTEDEIIEKIFKLQRESSPESIIAIHRQKLTELTILERHANNNFIQASLRSQLIKIRNAALKQLNVTSVDCQLSQSEIEEGRTTIKGIMLSPEISFKGLDDNRIKATVIAIEQILASLEEDGSNTINDDLADVISFMRASTNKPSLNSILEMIRSVGQAIIRNLQVLSLTPVKVCGELLNSNINSIRLPLRRLIRHSGTEFPNALIDVCDAIPQTTAAAVRVLGNNEEINANPYEIMSVLSKLAIASIQLEDVEKRNDINEAALELLRIFTELEYASIDSPEYDVISCTSEIINAIESENKMRLEELKIIMHAIEKRNKIKGEEVVVPDIDGDIDDSKYEALIQFTIDHTYNVFDDVSKLATAEDVANHIIECQQQFAKNISLVNEGTKKSSKYALQMLSYAGGGMTAGARGFEITGANPRTYLASFASSSFALMSLLQSAGDVELNKDLRRSIRTLKRMIGSLSDLIYDIEEDKEKKDIDISKYEGLNACVEVASLTMGVLTTYGVSLNEKAFLDIIKKQLSRFENAQNRSLDAFEKMKRSNTDINAEQLLERDYSKLSLSFAKFIDCSLERKPSAEELISFVTSITSSMARFVSSIDEISDVVIGMPDIENASRLPNGYSLPSATNSSQMKDIVNIINRERILVDDVIGQFEEAERHSNNSLIADNILSLISHMDILLSSALNVSEITLTLEIQSTITSDAAAVTAIMDSLIKATKSKFLNRGDWNEALNEFKENITPRLESLSWMGRRAFSAFTEEKRTRDNRLSQIISAIDVLRNSMAAIEAKTSEVDESTNAGVWSIKMLDLCSGACKTISLMLMTARSTKEKEPPETLIAFAHDLANQTTRICVSVGKMLKMEEPEIECINKMNEFSTEIADSRLESEHVAVISAAAQKIALAAEDSLKKRKNQKVTQNQKQNINIKHTISRDWLMEKLDLEARVIKARILLLKAEKAVASIY